MANFLQRNKTTIVLLSAVVVSVVIALLLRRWLRNLNQADLMDKNVQAFLKMIRYAEGTAGPNGYNTVFGGGTIANLSDHPAITGEWTGKTLSNAQCAGAGLGPGCKSTAAGAYQFIKPTWSRLKTMLNLPDFSPNSQDLAAVELIREAGALPDVKAGNIAAAITKVKKIWASMPGAGYSQPEKSLTALLSVYEQNGGNVV